MVIKTELCAFSETRIYPGHGSRFVRKDGQLVIFASSKNAALYHLRKKPAKLTWTQAWRRKHRKGKVETAAKRRTRKTAKLQRAIVGATLADIKAKREQTPATRKAAREAAAREVKDRKKKAKSAAKKTGGFAKGGQKAFAKHSGKGR